MKPNRQLKCAFYAQRHAAIGRRKIQWDLTFEEWLDIWTKSGFLHLRGRGKGKYAMGRKLDTGPYAVGNVYITLFEKNNQDQHIWNPNFDKDWWGGVKIKDPLGNVLEFPNLKTASRQLGLSYDMLWQRKTKNKKYRGYEFI